MKYFYKLIIAIFILTIPFKLLSADEKTAFIDIDYIVQNSNVGKKTLNNINILNQKNIKLLEKKNEDLRKLETSIKNKKNIVSENDFNNEVKAFQEKVQDFTNEKDQIVEEFNNFRNNELDKTFKLINPIITKYMSQNSINILLDSKNIFMGIGDSNITEDILKEINDQIK